MTRLSSWAHGALTLVVALCTVAAVLSTAPGTAPHSPRLSLAADTTQFDAGNIISDAMFFDPDGLNQSSVASFIRAKGVNCQPAPDGTPCLKDFRQDTFTRVPDGICDGTYTGAAAETAATIIWKVSHACNVSEKVLLVLLQKEQALLTASGSSLTARRYQIAAGMGCPDTASCDTQYYGFYNQVYSAAHQYQRYATYPTRYSYRAGASNTIYWSPTSSCGTSAVWIKNQATAGLYNYTPYRPNAAALRAGYGTGDSCSAYGNRNFWLYFTDWFGSTQSPGGDAVLAEYAALGGASGVLGPYTTWVICGLGNGGCGQVFQNGKIYWSSTSGARAILEPILSAWGAQGWEQGPAGYPTSEQICGLADGGCGQVFQNGRVYTSAASGTHVLTGAIHAAWVQQGFETGPLGYPTSDEICGLANGGCGQVFQGGRIYRSSASGTHVLTGAIHAAWVQQGFETGPLGYPTSDEICGLANGGCGQVFQGGRMYRSAASGLHTVSGAIQAAWVQQGYENGPLGYPTGDQVCGLADGGCKQAFQGGTLYSSPTAGTYPVSGATATAWTAAGAESGTLGYPTTGLICGLADGGCGQVFQGGRIYTSPAGGTHALSGPIHTAWVRQGYENGPLGYPTGDQVCGLADGGCKQAFQGGTLYFSPTAGTYPVSGATATAFTAAGAESGTLGYPTTGLICGLKNTGCGQVFQGGRIYTSPASGTHALSGSIHTAWVQQGYENGPLGYPTSDEICGLADGGCGQVFQGGRIYRSPTTGTHVLTGPIHTAWVQQGYEAGPLGYPTSEVICGLKNGGCGQVFQGGRIYTTTATGAHPLSGPIHTAWVAQGYENGPLGYATSDPYAVPGGTAQNFQGGKLTLDQATGVVTRS